MASRKYKRATKYTCAHCGLMFLSHEALVSHAKDTLTIGNDSSCIKTLLECAFCGELWHNQRSLDRHMAANNICKRIQQQEHSLSVLTREAAIVIDDIDSNTNVSPDAFGTPKDNTLKHARINGIEISLDQAVHRRTKKPRTKHGDKSYQFKYHKNSTAQHLPPQIMDSSQKYKLTKENIDIHIDMNRDEYNDDLTSHASKFFSQLLARCQRYNDGMLEGTVREILIQIRNASMCAELESGDSTLPGFESTYHFSDVSDEQIVMFVLKHNNESISMAEHDLEQEEESDNHFTVLDNDTSDSRVDRNTNLHNNAINNNRPHQNNTNVEGTNEDDQTTRIIDESMKSIKDHVTTTRETSMYDKSDIAMIELLDILHNTGAPLGLFDKLTSWCKRSSDAFTNEKITSREAFLNRLSHKVYGRHLSSELRPRVVTHRLASGSNIEITKFSFKAQLTSILINDDLMTEDNLLLNRVNPFTPPDEDMALEDLNSGWWWRETWLDTCKREDEILCPIVFFLDGGKATKRMSVEPLTFTIGLFKRQVRNMSQAWRTLGYIESLDNMIGSDKTDTGAKATMNVTAKMNDYHSMLSLLLSELKTLQGKDGGLAWTLSLGEKKYNVVLKFAIQLVIGDCKGNNILCGQYGGHSILSKRLCRDCDVAPSDADDPYHVCKFTSIDEVRGKNQKELKMMSMHCITNAFDNMYFGARTSSIYDCTPPEPLHGILLGTIKYLFEEFERLVPNSSMDMINQYVKHWYHNRVTHEHHIDIPSIVTFQNGITKCDSITAKHQYSRLFVIFVSLHVPGIFRSMALDKRTKRVKEDGSDTFRFVDVDPIGVSEAKKWFFLIQDSLIMYQWVMKDTHNKNDFHVPERRANTRSQRVECLPQQAIREYMRAYRHLIGNRPGHGLKITKFHQLLHYTRQIEKDGSIENIDSGICEGLAVSMYKRLVTKTQRKQATLNRDLANRHTECVLVEEATRLTKKLWEKTSSRKKGKMPSLDNHQTLCGTRFEMEFPKFASGNVKIRWYSKTKNIAFDHDLCSMLTHRLFLNTSDGGCLSHDTIVKGYTEYFDDHGILYRAHPNYRGNGEWNDWCLVRWEGISELLPAKIVTFIDLTNCDFMSNEDQGYLQEWIEDEWDGQPLPPSDETRRVPYLTNGKWVVVQSGMAKDELMQKDGRRVINRDRLSGDVAFCIKSKISKRFRLESCYRILPINMIVGPSYCIPIDHRYGNTEYIEVTTPSKWPALFIERENKDTS